MCGVMMELGTQIEGYLFLIRHYMHHSYGFFAVFKATKPKIPAHIAHSGSFRV